VKNQDFGSEPAQHPILSPDRDEQDIRSLVQKLSGITNLSWSNPSGSCRTLIETDVTRA